MSVFVSTSSVSMRFVVVRPGRSSIWHNNKLVTLKKRGTFTLAKASSAGCGRLRAGRSGNEFVSDFDADVDVARTSTQSARSRCPSAQASRVCRHRLADGYDRAYSCRETKCGSVLSFGRQVHGAFGSSKTTCDHCRG